MKKKIIVFSLLLSALCVAAQQVPKTLEEQLALDNPRVIKYLQSLNASDSGKKLKGIRLSDGSISLKNYVFIETINSAKNKFNVYVFRYNRRKIAYAWVESDGKSLPIPSCPSNYEEEGQYVLSGDIYTWTDIQPGDGVVIIECVTDKWINEIKTTK
jgi:hypothetical protein